MSLKPWREVVQPHEDVLDGKFDESEFAADLTKVVAGVARAEYQNPVRFFERTVVTEGMGLLLQSVMKRLAGQGGDPVVQLQTAFGGGKTHTMMAVLHVARGEVPASSLQGIAPLLDKAKVTSLPKAKVAVLDGNQLAPSEPRKHGAIKARTLWGELAWQLGGKDGYDLVAASDEKGTSPGKEVLADLLTRNGPCVILMDETVAYLRQLEHGKSYEGGTYSSNLSFLQALTEAVSRVPNAMLLASLPESMMEVGDQVGKDALDAVQKLFGRIEAVWKPVGTDEAFEIVRRRLFKTDQNTAARDAVCAAFAELYTTHGDKFPTEAKDGAYLRRLKASYPIHPEIFERLYQDWSGLPKFQRTRGVLRLMARLVHSLWRHDNRDLLILPGSIPLDDTQVRNELVKYLPNGWEPILDKDIDGPNAAPRAIDDRTPTLGSIQACRRAARTIFLASAPSVASQTVRGIGVERVRLGCAQPEQSPARYDDALKRLTDELHNLYTGNDRYWFDLRANLRREMEDRMHRFEAKQHLYPEIENRLRKAVKCSVVDAVHVFADSKDVPDKPELRLVVLDPEHGHKRKDINSLGVAGATAMLGKHGEKPRENQNCLLFLAPDQNVVGSLKEHVRRFLAWQQIVEETDALNLDKHHEKEAKKHLEEASSRVDACLKETYRYLLVPLQEVDSGSPGPVQWEDEALNLSLGSYDKAITTTTREREWIIGAWAPTHLANLLQRWFWKSDSLAVSALKVWRDTCRYLYLPRLAKQDVFVQTIRDGVIHRDFFAFAAGTERDAKRLTGLLFGKAGGVYLDDTALLVHPEVAALAEKEQFAEQAATSTGSSGGSPPTSSGGTGIGNANSAKKVPTSTGPAPMPHRFHGTAEVDANDPNASFASIVENVIQHFTAKYGTNVRITVDVEAKSSAGFETGTVRTVKENATQLKFKTADFEAE